MKMLMRTVKKTKTVATLFILLSLACFLTSLRSHFTADTQNSDAVSYTDDHQSYQVIYGLDEQIQMHVLYYFMDIILMIVFSDELTFNTQTGVCGLSG